MAGLPNITGRFSAVSDNWTRTGAFTHGGGTGANFNAGTFGYPLDRYYDFNASLSSSFYGSSTTVTPLSLSTSYILKY